MSKLTVKELKNMLDQDNIKYTSKMTKQQLLELMPKPVEEEPVEEEPVVLMSQKHFRFNPVNETVDPVISKVIEDIFRDREHVKKSRKKKSENVVENVVDNVVVEREQELPEPEGKLKVLPEGKLKVLPEEPKKRSLWVDCIKEYCKSKGHGYKIYSKDSKEYLEILDLYNKKKTSKQA